MHQRNDLILQRLLLRWQKTETLLQGDSVSRVLVIWGESRWVGRLGDLAGLGVLLEGVDSLAVWASGVHQMHLESGGSLAVSWAPLSQAVRK